MSLLEALGLAPPRARGETGRARSRSEAPRPDPNASAPDVERERAERRRAALSAALQAAKQKAATAPTPAPGAVNAARDTLAKQDKAVEEAVAGEDWIAANAALTQLEQAVKDFESAFTEENAKAEGRYREGKAKVQTFLDKMGRAVDAQAFGDPPHPHYNGQVDLFKGGRQHMQAGEAAGNWVQAERGLKSAQNVERLLAHGHGAIRTEWQQREAAAKKALASLAQPAAKALDGKALQAAFDRAATAVPRAESHLEVAAAAAALKSLDDELQALRLAKAKQLAGGNPKQAKALRGQAAALLKDEPELLNLLAAEPQGPALIDAMMAELGGQAKDADSKAFARAAITARFGPKLGDKDLTTKYLPRLYKALSMVPPSHTKTNPMLKQIDRTRTKVMPSGTYFDGTGNIDLQTPRTGLVDSLVSFGAALMPGQLGGIGVSQFDVLTLHEVGHSVDDARQFMNSKVGNVTWGGWTNHKVEEVAKAVADGRGLIAAFPKLPRPFLEACVKAVLLKKTPSAEKEVTDLANGTAVDWKALDKHAAFDTARAIRMSGDSSGLWDKGDSGAAKHAIGGSVYQQAYDEQWVSYALSARSAKVSDYQFRAEGEWYAEAYAAYYLGKLKTSHPLHAVLKADGPPTRKR